MKTPQQGSAMPAGENIKLEAARTLCPKQHATQPIAGLWLFKASLTYIFALSARMSVMPELAIRLFVFICGFV